MGLELFFEPRLTELGKIKIGGLGQERTSQKGTTYRQPEKHDYFTITSMNRTKAGDLEPDVDLMEQLTKEYSSGDGMLRRIPVRLLSNDPEEVMQSAYVWYGGKTCAARSDHKTVTWFFDRRNGARLPEPITEPWDDAFLELKNTRGQKLFKLHTVLNCVIHAREARFGGVYRFRTTSVISGRQLYSNLIEAYRLTNGVLVGLPFFLVVRPVQVSPEGKPTTVYVVHLELRAPDLNALQDQALTQMRFMVEHKAQMQIVETQYKRLMLPPGHEPNADAAEINAEFQPETAEEKAPEAPAADEPDPLLDKIEKSSGALDGGEAATRPAEPLAGGADAPLEHETAGDVSAQDSGTVSGGEASEDASTRSAGDAVPETAAAPAEPDPLESTPPKPAIPPEPATIGRVEADRIVVFRKDLNLRTKESWLAWLASVNLPEPVTMVQALDTIKALEAAVTARKAERPVRIAEVARWLDLATNPEEKAFGEFCAAHSLRKKPDPEKLKDSDLALVVEYVREHPLAV